jgi:cell division protein FtsL
VTAPFGEVNVITNVPPVGASSVSIVNYPGAVTMPLTFPPVFAQTLHPQPMAAPPSFNFSQVSTQLSTTVVQREVPGAAAFAAEFHDLRDMLDRDRANFESSRSQFERAMAERELKVKLDEEKLTSEWSRLRAEQEALEKKNSADTIVVKTLQEGQAMDVKDGVIDGKFNGKQIVVEGVGPLIPPPHLMGKRVPPPGKGGPPSMSGKGGPMGKGGPPGKGGPMGKGGPPSMSGKGGPPMPGKGGAGKGGPPTIPGMQPGKGGPGKGGPPGPPGGKGSPPPAGKGKGK